MAVKADFTRIMLLYGVSYQFDFLVKHVRAFCVLMIYLDLSLREAQSHQLKYILKAKNYQKILHTQYVYLKI